MLLFSMTRLSIVSTFLVSLLQRVCNGQVLINEVAVTPIEGVCADADYVELINAGATEVSLAGWVLYDGAGPFSTDAFIFPQDFSLAAGEIRFICRYAFDSFQFGISRSEEIALEDDSGEVVSTTGTIPGFGDSFTSYSYSANTGTYDFLPATPGTFNGVTPKGILIINEVVPVGTTNSVNTCSGGPFVEIYNDAFATVDLAGYTLRVLTRTEPLSGTIGKFAFNTMCVDSNFINPNDSVDLFDPQGIRMSSTGPIGGTSPLPIAPDLSWVRVTDLLQTITPFEPFYQYSTTPTPNAPNIFPFVPEQLPIQSLPTLSSYEFAASQDLSFLNGGNPELSGGTFDPRTCNYFSVGDDGRLVEISISACGPIVVSDRPLIGGSLPSDIYGSTPDSEGVCFYRDTVNGDKIAIVDERDYSVHICDIPASDQRVPLFRDSSNCQIAKLSPAQIADPNLANPEENGRFEAIACDPGNGKIYVGNEFSPMLVWSLDYTSGVYDVLIDAERLPDWQDFVFEINGMEYDPIGQTLYVLNTIEQVIFQSTLNGTLIDFLEVFDVLEPGGMSFEPATGDLIVIGEPGEIALYVSTETKSPTNAPTKVPTLSPTKAPTNAPTTSPTFKPTQAPTEAPTLSPTKAPTKTPTESPTKVPTKSPTRAPTKNPTMSPSKAPTKSPTKVPTKSPTKAPTKNPTKAPVPVGVVPISVPAKVPTDTPSTSPSSSPMKAPVIAPVPVNVPIPMAPMAPITPPVAAPVAPITLPTTAPTAPAAVPLPVPVKAPSAPVKAPTKTSTNAPTKAPSAPVVVPTDTPTREPCGLLNLSIFCPLTGCGVFGRAVGLCNES